LELGDSLHLPAMLDILPILCWASNGPGQFAPPPEQVHIQPGHIDYQRTLAGGGSCTVASCNFVETSVGLPIPRWQAIESAKFCNMFLQDILLYYLLAHQ
ncbi:hypothetical protein B0H14DRAFT_2283695, partial [Mycena olivaceomarginata]